MGGKTSKSRRCYRNVRELTQHQIRNDGKYTHWLINQRRESRAAGQRDATTDTDANDEPDMNGVHAVWEVSAAV